MASLVFIYEVSEPLVTKPFPGFGCCICPFTIQIGQGCTKRCHIGLPGCQTQFSLPPYGRIILSSSDDRSNFAVIVIGTTAVIYPSGSNSRDFKYNSASYWLWASATSGLSKSMLRQSLPPSQSCYDSQMRWCHEAPC